MKVNKSEVKDLRLNKSDDLAKLAEILGYKETGRFAINQLQCDNGAYVSSLLRLLDDNPDLMETIREWVLKNLTEDDSEEEEFECASPECEAAGQHVRGCSS